MGRHLDFQIVDDDAQTSQISHLLSLAKDSQEPELMAGSDAPLPGAGVALYTWGALAFGCVAFLAASVATGPESGPHLIDMARTAPGQSPQVERVVAMGENGSLKHNTWLADRGTLDPNPVGAVAPKPTTKEPIEMNVTGLPAPLPVMEHQRTGELRADVTHSTGKHAARLRAPDGTSISPKLFGHLAQRAPDLMGRLTANTADGELVAGPFTTRDSVASFCRSVVLRLTLGCDPVEWPSSDG